MEMQDESVNILRENTRNLLKTNRQIHKNEECDLRRSIKDIRVTADNISEIANKLKSKSAISVGELKMIKKGLMDDRRNIDVFLNVHGALRGLIRELTGSNAKKQCVAAGICCYLGTGDARCCAAVGKAAGPYLVAALDSLTVELAVTCAWALGNLAGAGPAACAALGAQGALAALSEPRVPAELQHAALYALTHFAYRMGDDLRPEHLARIVRTLSKSELDLTFAHLLFVVSCHERFTEYLTRELLHALLRDVGAAARAHVACTRLRGCCRLPYVLRTLANADTAYDVISNYFVANDTFEIFRKLLSGGDAAVDDAVLWLWGNLYNRSGDDIFVPNSSL